MGQFVGNVAAKALNVPFGIVDLSLAPTPSQGDSVARSWKKLAWKASVHQEQRLLWHY